MSKLLILFTKGFPYGTSEPFLENEYPLYKEYFEKVLIVTACKPGELPTRSVIDPTIEFVKDYTQAGHFLSILGALPWMLTDSMFYRELKRLYQSKGLTFRNLQNMLIVSLCGNHRAKLAYRWLRKHPEYSPDTLYGYWMNIPAYSALRLNRKLKNKCKTISRTHGFDLYLDRYQNGYIPFHQQIYTQLTEVHPISLHGKRYLEELYGDSGKISVHRLGALDQGLENPLCQTTLLRIVTCARTIPLKRLNRVVDALSRIRDWPIHWTHMGSGPSQKELEEYAARNLPANVTVTFTGTVSNSEVYETYRSQPFHIFLNISETEGLPVSIMEAMSFHIPIIATAVGGTPEIVDDGINGYLLPKDYSDDELVALLRQIIHMPQQEYIQLRHQARNKYQTEYNAITNYRHFIEKLVPQKELT